MTAPTRTLAACLAASACFVDSGPPLGDTTSNATTAPATTAATDPGTTTTGGAATDLPVTTGDPLTTAPDATTSLATTTSTSTSGEATTDTPIGPCGDDPDLIACFRFENYDGTLVDDSPFAHHASAEQASLTGGVTGMALDVTPESTVQAPHADHLSPGQRVTVTAWIYPRSIPVDDSIRIIAEKDDEYSILLTKDGVGCSFKDDVYPQVYRDVAVDTWAHVACVHSTSQDGTHTLYVDGNFVVAEANGPAGDGSNAALAIGDDSYLADFGFHGRIDELRIYARALNADEVAALAAP